LRRKLVSAILTIAIMASLAMAFEKQTYACNTAFSTISASNTFNMAVATDGTLWAWASTTAPDWDLLMVITPKAS